jgi:hypothetical protein
MDPLSPLFETTAAAMEVVVAIRNLSVWDKPPLRLKRHQKEGTISNNDKNIC